MSLQEYLASSVCRSAAVRETLPDGFLMCRIKPKPLGTPPLDQKDWVTSYIAPKNVYTTPYGKRFVVNCDSGVFSYTITSCDVAYDLVSDIDIFYRFLPYLGPFPVRIENIVAFDRLLRAAVEKAVVKNYPWRR